MNFLGGQPHHNKLIILAALAVWAGVGFFLTQRSLAGPAPIDVFFSNATSVTVIAGQTNTAASLHIGSNGTYDGEPMRVSWTCPTGITCTINGHSSAYTRVLPYNDEKRIYDSINDPIVITAAANGASSGNLAATVEYPVDSGTHYTATLPITVQDFTIQGGGAQGVYVPAGDASPSFDLEIQSKNGLTGNVQLSAVSLPQGVNAVWEDGGSDTVALPSGNTVGHKHFHLQTSASTSPGTVTYQIQAQLVGGTLTHATGSNTFTVTDFIVAMVNLSQTVEQGKRTGNYNIQVAGREQFKNVPYPFTGTITLSVQWQGTAPSGVQYYWNGSSTAATTYDVALSGGAQQLPSLAIDVPLAVPIGDYHFHIQGTYTSGLTHTTADPAATMTVLAAGSGFTQSDLTLNVVKEDRGNLPGTNSGPFTIWATAQNNFTGVVTFTVNWLSGAPSNTSVHWEGVCSDNHTLSCDDPDGRFVGNGCGTCSGRDIATITFATGENVRTKGLYFAIGSDAQSGTYPFNVTATYETGSVTFPSDNSLTLNVGQKPTGDFLLYNSPGTISANPGSSATTTVTVLGNDGFSQPVDLTVDTGSPKIAGALVPTSVTPTNSPATSTLTLSPASDIPCGTYNFSVTGISGSLTHTGNGRLIVCAPNFTMTVAPTSQSAQQGQSSTYTITVTPNNGFSGQVSLDVQDCPPASTCSYAGGATNVTLPGNGPGGQASIDLTVQTQKPATPPAPYVVMATGNGNGASASVAAMLTVLEGDSADFSITSVTPNPLTLDPNSGGSYTVTIDRTGGFTGDVTINWTAVPTP